MLIVVDLIQYVVDIFFYVDVIKLLLQTSLFNVLHKWLILPMNNPAPSLSQNGLAQPCWLLTAAVRLSIWARRTGSVDCRLYSEPYPSWSLLMPAFMYVSALAFAQSVRPLIHEIHRDWSPIFWYFGVFVSEIIVLHATELCSDAIDLFDQDAVDLVVLVRGKHVFHVRDCSAWLLLLVVCHCLVRVDNAYAHICKLFI